MLSKDIVEKYKKAGEIAGTIRKEVLNFVRPGMNLLEIAEFVESRIEKYGGKAAFPVNISVNEIAAHYTPSIGEQKVVQEGDLVKIDIGVHVDGYIGDLACTYCSEKNRLVDVSKKVMEDVIKILKPGVTVAEIGEFIENSAKGPGCGVITNLTGHGVDKYKFHMAPSIPNVANNDMYELQEGDVIAIEPFIAESNGYVKDTEIIEIYRFLQERPVRLPEARKILELAKNEFNQLPFAKRWLAQYFSPLKITMALRQLEQSGALETHPVLREASGKTIAQTEETIIIAPKPVVTTRIE